MDRTVCPITRKDFFEAARPLAVKVDSQSMAANPKQFSTGSFGYYANGKVTIQVNGVPVSFQVGITLTAVGSKDSREYPSGNVARVESPALAS